MKILYILHSSADNGSEKAFYNMISDMQNYDVEPIVILPGQGKLYTELNELGIKQYNLPIRMNVYPPLTTLKDKLLYLPRLAKTLLYNSITKLKLKKIITCELPDIIHTNTGVVHIGSDLAKQKVIPHVWHIREFQDLNFGWIPFPGKKNFSKRLHFENNHLIAITKAIFEHYQMSGKKDTIIYDGVFNEKNIPIIKYKKENYILYVGRIEKTKGISDLLTVFADIAENYTFDLWIAGKGEEIYYNKIQQFIKEKNITNRVKFLGHCSDVAQIMSNALAIIVPSHFEGFGFVTTEAMLNGCLVIGKNTAGTKEQFDNGLELTGEEIGIRYNTEEELATAIHQVVEKGIDHYFPVIDRAQEVVLKLYTIEQSTTKVYEVYKSILNKKQCNYDK
jgi:glycosyltransferase involved in cell wall biosynthesis